MDVPKKARASRGRLQGSALAREEEGRRALDFSTVSRHLLQERYTGPNYRETTGTLERRGDSADLYGAIQRIELGVIQRSQGGDSACITPLLSQICPQLPTPTPQGVIQRSRPSPESIAIPIAARGDSADDNTTRGVNQRAQGVIQRSVETSRHGPNTPWAWRSACQAEYSCRSIRG